MKSKQTQSPDSLDRLVRRIRYAYDRRRSYVATFEEVEVCRDNAWEGITDITDRIARKARVDWLVYYDQGEARFFEGM